MDLLDLLHAWNEATTALLDCRRRHFDTDSQRACGHLEPSVQAAREAFFVELERLMDERLKNGQ